MDLEALEFKKLALPQVQSLVEWAKVEGWNPGPHDAEAYFATDPDGFYGYFLNQTMIGGGSLVSYNGHFGFMGFFIVKPAFRSQGIGQKLWYLRRSKLLERLQNNAAIGMDGVVSMQPFYQKGGFNIAYRDVRYQITGSSFAVHKNISPISNLDFNAIADFDALHFGFFRPQFLKAWLAIPQIVSYKYVENGKIIGMAILRKAHLGFKICPLFANTPHVAEALFQACLNSAKNQPVFLDVPEKNKQAMALAKKYNATYVFECARMYYGKAPEVKIDGIYGVTTFELG